MWQQLEAETTPVAVLHALWMGAAEGFLEGEPLLQRLRGGGEGGGGSSAAMARPHHTPCLDPGRGIVHCIRAATSSCELREARPGCQRSACQSISGASQACHI